MTHWSKLVKRLNILWLRFGIPEYRAMMIKIVEEYLNSHSNWNILDCGCGTGLFFKLLKDEYKNRYKGIDFTPEMIDHCKKTFPDYRESFKIGDITNPDDIEQTHIIITQNVIQHILPYQIATKNLIDKTTKVLICCERTHSNPSKIYGYKPIRWRFKDTDMLKIFDYLGNDREFKKSRIIARPKSTEKLSNVLAIYLIEKINL